MNYAENWTEQQLKKLERRIRREYETALKEISSVIDNFFNGTAYENSAGEMVRGKSLAEKAKAFQELVANGEKTQQDYKLWLLNQAGRGKRFNAMRDKIANRLTNTKSIALKYVNDATPGIYSLNRNYEAYLIERMTGAADFNLFNESSVRRLLVNQPDVMPYYPKSRALQRGIDLEYGKKKISQYIASGIMRGASIADIAASLRDDITNMSYRSSVLAARTAVTGAQNGGRMDTIHAAEQMGIKTQKQWVATLDNRTRHSHAEMDGVRVNPDEKFPNGLMFPGDPSGEPAEVYNCRCAMITVLAGYEYGNTHKEIDPETGEPRTVNNISYKQWEQMKYKASAKLRNNKQAAENDLNSIDQKSIIKLEHGFSAFPKNQEIAQNMLDVKPIDGYYDVGMHGYPYGVGIGTEQVNADARLLANIIKHMDNYDGSPIRLLSCSTGVYANDDYCIAEALANALGVNVIAPNDVLYIHEHGKITIGDFDDGEMIEYKPNQRRRIK